MERFLFYLVSKNRAIIKTVLNVSFTVTIIALFSSSCTLYRSTPYQESIKQKIAYYSFYSKRHLINYFKQANVPYPPQHIALLIFKQSRHLELYSNHLGRWHYIKSYEITAASGKLGPKLHEGDRQVPEGIYHIVELNPLSHYRLSMKINYPNRFDRAIAKNNHRHNLGGDIYIHGRASSMGCIAIGDPGIEELFPLVALVGIHNTDVMIAPNDFRINQSVYNQEHAQWLATLYHTIHSSLKKFPLPKEYSSSLL